jgi:transcriptional regulator with XRE-family HTH domain
MEVIYLSEENTSSEIGQILKNARNDKGYTLRELGEKCSITYSYISAVERGAFKPSKDKLIKLAHALELNTDDLLVLAGFSPVEEEVVRSRIVDPAAGTGGFLVSSMVGSGKTYHLEGLAERIFLERYANVEYETLSKKPKTIKEKKREEKDINDYLKSLPPFAKEDIYYIMPDDSMEGEGIKIGYKVWIDRNKEFHSGKIYLIRVQGKEYLRRVFEDNDKYLVQGTRGIAPKVYNKKKLKVIGQAVRVEFDLD